jgi:hypothetical protein
MSYLTLQFVELENLLLEAAGSDALRVHVLEQTRTTMSNGLSRQEISIGLCVRAIVPQQLILSWYYPVDRLVAYFPHDREGGPDPAEARYEAAWEQASAWQTALIERLQQEKYVVYRDGMVELNVTSYLPGATNLIALPTTNTTAT